MLVGPGQLDFPLATESKTYLERSTKCSFYNTKGSTGSTIEIMSLVSFHGTQRRHSLASLVLPIQMCLVMLHAIILAGKTGPTVCPWANVFPFASVGSEVACQVAQCSEQPAASLTSVLSLA